MTSLLQPLSTLEMKTFELEFEINMHLCISEHNAFLSSLLFVSRMSDMIFTIFKVENGSTVGAAVVLVIPEIDLQIVS